MMREWMTVLDRQVSWTCHPRTRLNLTGRGTHPPHLLATVNGRRSSLGATNQQQPEVVGFFLPESVRSFEPLSRWSNSNAGNASVSSSAGDGFKV